MTETKVRSVRFPDDVAAAVEKACETAGMSFNAYVVDVLRTHLLQSAAEIEWMAALRAWLLASFDRSAFPADVTRRVFMWIRHSPDLWAGYQALVAGDDGRVDPERRAHLHKAVGRMVKQALNADVFGRVVDLDPAECLIRSHALLRPGSATRAGIGNKGDEDNE